MGVAHTPLMDTLNHRLDYANLAAGYAAHRCAQPALLAALVETSGVDERSVAVEVGCGTGNYSAALAAKTGCRTLGIEPNAAMLEIAWQRAGTVKWMQATAESFALADDSIDLIFTVDVIHHLVDRQAYFRNAFRALKPGGLICTATDSPSVLRRRQPLAGYFPPTIRADLARYPAPDRLRNEMRSAGLAPTGEDEVEYPFLLTDIAPYRDRAYSVLHLIDDDAFAQGIDRMRKDLATEPIRALSLYWLLWGVKL